MANRVTSNVIEALSAGGSPKIRVTSNVAEVLNKGATAKIRVTSNVIEVLSSLSPQPPSKWKPVGAHKLALEDEEPWRPPAPRLFAPVVVPVNVLPASRWRMPTFDDPEPDYEVRPRRRTFTPIILQGDTGYTFIIF